MSSKKTRTKTNKINQIISEARQDRARLEKTYRERALKMFPKICARCGREFSGRRIRELTVHHKDHNHDNNPPDGSNWELLCIYCHDHEHETREHDARAAGTVTVGERAPPVANPFANLDEVLRKKQGTE